MNFYCIYKKEDESVRLLKEAAAEKKIKFISLHPQKYDYSEKINFSKKDLLYRVSTEKESSDLEKFLINREITTFHKTYTRALNTPSSTLIYEKENISTPKTIYRLTRNKQLLKKYSRLLGFPLIIKSMGGSHGVGVIKVDSLSSLFSIADYLIANEKNGMFVMKEFISASSSARLIVLGNKVIDSIEYLAPEGDFRSNEGANPNVKTKSFSKEIENIAIQATRALEIEFSGVDILIDKKGKGYLAETNFPCFFPRAQILTGKNIAGMMLEHLIEKATK